MKKRNLAAAGLAAVMLAGFGTVMQVSAANIVINDNRSQQSDEGSTESQAADAAAAGGVFSETDFDVNGYLYENSYGDSLYFLTVKNNSQTAAAVSGNATAKDAGGAILGAGDMSIDIVGPGEETIGYFYFDGISGIDTVDYQLSYSDRSYYEPVIGNLSVEQSLNNSNVTVTVTNNGETSAQFVEAYALFMDAEDHVIDYTSNYIIDPDNEIKPGISLSSQLDCREAYDHVLVYFTGRSDGTPASAEGSLVTDEFSANGYLLEDGFGDSQYFLIVTNNSSETCAVGGNAVARDASGNALGAGDMTLEVLGPGETSIGYCYFDGVSGIASVDYQLLCGETYYEPVLKDLSAEVTVNNENVIVVVTNNGANPAQFLEAYALFFDAENNLISCESGYVIDDDSELKPGATLSEQLDAEEAFDHVEVYFTGRYNE